MLGLSLSLVGVLVFSSMWGEWATVMLVLIWFFTMSSWDFFLFKMGSGFEMDSISYSLVILSLWVLVFSVLGSGKVKLMEGNSEFMGLVSSLCLALVLSFSFSDYMLFYLSFETSLIPVLMLILGWGYQPERARAGTYMLMYTLLASLPLFYMILNMKWSGGSLYMYFPMKDPYISGGMKLAYIGAFLVKFPMYSVHVWLPKAHVEAPMAGSMLLAGVLLKLGGYGLLRMLPYLSGAGYMLSSVMISISLWGGFFVSLVCLRQLDIKVLIAYSSVVHMSGCISGLLVLSEWGYKGSVAMMVGHGLCSSGLFYMANVVYERTGSRSMMVSKGLVNSMPMMSFWWFMLLSANMAAPPTLNLVGEVMLIMSILSWCKVSGLILSVLSFFSACYSLYLFSLSQHGGYLYSKKGFYSGRVMEYSVAFMHWAPLNLVILMSGWVV
uniref:NADH-ubiquinone oxidoreductase chain 4 n=1 Tax=Pseudocrangonyx daejeonensis TaxID=2038767 RepID=A0A346SAG2_9CRUS|nr:NADH dehydrogenase subunit 4 [Pseudocrangonyx daejeonensis]AXT17550.1 NADH dehydrogenase subunit 4 [Pseudocrangonyx daejeonensis]